MSDRSPVTGDVVVAKSTLLVHPVERIERDGDRMENAREMHRLRASYGWALPATLTLERQHLQSVRRLGGLKSSNILLDHYNNRLTDIDPQDYFLSAQPGMNPDRRQLTAFQAMDRDCFGEVAENPMERRVAL